MRFKPGQIVHIPCDVKPGAFPVESFVTIETDTGIISGFVKTHFLVQFGSQFFLAGRIVEVAKDIIKVRVPGSFFTTALGLASATPAWAESHLQHA